MFAFGEIRSIVPFSIICMSIFFYVPNRRPISLIIHVQGHLLLPILFLLGVPFPVQSAVPLSPHRDIRSFICVPTLFLFWAFLSLLKLGRLDIANV